MPKVQLWEHMLEKMDNYRFVRYANMRIGKLLTCMQIHILERQYVRGGLEVTGFRAIICPVM